MAAAAAGALVLSGCGSSHHRAAPSHPSTTEPTSVAAPAPTPSPVGEVSFAVGSPAPDNWNVLAAGGAGSTLGQVAAQLWPSAFVVGPNYVPSLNTALLTSATVTSESPQIVVYRINPSATWSDGVPITGQDFIYSWLAQSGRRSPTDIGGRPFTPATTAGYSHIAGIDVAPLRPDVVTVRFSTPYPDWKSLFSYLIPAHVAERIGFDDGFTDPVLDLVSGGPYLVQSYTEGEQLRLVRNPSFSGPPATALALDFDFVPYPPQMVRALSAGQVSCADVPATPATLLPLMGDKSLSVKVTGGGTYLDLDFREGTGAAGVGPPAPGHCGCDQPPGHHHGGAWDRASRGDSGRQPVLHARTARLRGRWPHHRSNPRRAQQLERAASSADRGLRSVLGRRRPPDRVGTGSGGNCCEPGDGRVGYYRAGQHRLGLGHRAKVAHAVSRVRH